MCTLHTWLAEGLCDFIHIPHVVVYTTNSLIVNALHTCLELAPVHTLHTGVHAIVPILIMQLERVQYSVHTLFTENIHGTAYISHTEKDHVTMHILHTEKIHVTVHILHRKLEKVCLIVHTYTDD